MKLSQNTFIGRGTPPPGPSPTWRYPVESRFNTLASDIVQREETLNVSAPIRVYRRLADPFGTTSSFGMLPTKILLATFMLPCLWLSVAPHSATSSCASGFEHSCQYPGRCSCHTPSCRQKCHLVICWRFDPLDPGERNRQIFVLNKPEVEPFQKPHVVADGVLLVWAPALFCRRR